MPTKEAFSFSRKRQFSALRFLSGERGTFFFERKPPLNRSLTLMQPQGGKQLLLGAVAHGGGNGSALLDEQYRGDAGDPKPCRQGALLVHVHLADENFALVFSGEFFNDGADAAAGAAPGSPEVHENGNGRLDNDAFEIGIGNCDGHGVSSIETYR